MAEKAKDTAVVEEVAEDKPKKAAPKKAAPKKAAAPKEAPAKKTAPKKTASDKAPAKKVAKDKDSAEKAPAKKAPAKKTVKKLKVTQKKSAIGKKKDQGATLRALGLRKIRQSVLHDDTPVIRGMVFKVKHLIEVEEVEV